MIMRLLLTGSLFIAAQSGDARSAAAVPLPPHWTVEAPDPDDDRGTVPPLRGVYGHGFEGLLNDAYDPGRHQPLCAGDEAAQAAFVAAVGDHQTEFWVYMTGAQGVLFSRSLVIASDRPCSATPQYLHLVERALIADGVIHSFEVEEGGETLEQTRTRRAGVDDGEYSGSFSQLHNLMARRPSGTARGRARGTRIRRETIAGHPARCSVSGGLVWSSVCRTLAPGRARGMIVATAAGDDERTMFYMRFDRVEPDALLDGRLFDLDWRWLDPTLAQER